MVLYGSVFKNRAMAGIVARFGYMALWRHVMASNRCFGVMASKVYGNG